MSPLQEATRLLAWAGVALGFVAVVILFIVAALTLSAIVGGYRAYRHELLAGTRKLPEESDDDGDTPS